MREKGSSGVEAECSRSTRDWGWKSEPIRDGLRCGNCGALIYPSAQPGTFDVEAYIPCWELKELRHAYIEVKSGETSLSFSRLLDTQLAWAEEKQAEDERVDLWMWVCIGRGVHYLDYPRQTFFFPYEMWHHLESTLDRKSIPHGCQQLIPYQLEWAGGGIWTLPKDHMARKIYGYETQC